MRKSTSAWRSACARDARANVDSGALRTEERGRDRRGKARVSERCDKDERERVCERERREFGRGERVIFDGSRGGGGMNRTGVRKQLTGKPTSIRCIYIIFNICIFIYTYIIDG